MRVLILVIATIFNGAAAAATVDRAGAMACPSIDAWEQIMEKLHSGGDGAAARIGEKAGCVSVPKGTLVDVVSRIGPLSRVVASSREVFYFRSADLQ